MEKMSIHLQCYNTSCGKKYNEEENHDDACQYHPGKPYFHDGYKEWTCCKMRSRDFSVFIEFKGCTKGRHSNIKPEASKQSLISSEPIECPVNQELNNEQNQTDIEKSITIDPDLEEMIPIIESPNVATALPAAQTMICKNCKNEESKLDMNSPCLYHKGIQIFHDAYKFWSCCQHKKFSDFEDFQKLPTCARADRHEMILKIEHKENWFQTGGILTIALYGLKGARNIDEKSKALLRGGRTLSIHLANKDGLIIFEKEWILRDYVLGEHSKVDINPSNVQITLKKLNEKNHWSSLVMETNK